MATRFVCAVLLFIGCNTKFHVLDTDDAGPAGSASMVDAGASDAGPPHAAPPEDAGMPETGGCYGTASYGGLLYSHPPIDGLNGVELYEGCDGAPIVLHGPGLPHYDAGAREQYRVWLDDMDLEAAVTLGPCCPSAGAASGTCIVWPMDAEVRAQFASGDYTWVVNDMWLAGASSTVDGVSPPNCMPIRRP
ncbi:MAG: hypothetical protein AB7S26_19905 [Sandaracinaceae bacterium]